MKKIFIMLCLAFNSCFAITLSKQSINLDNSQLDYYKVGNGSPIVMLIGYGLTNNFWTKQFIECLSQEHTVYVLDSLDRPNLASMADEVHDFIIDLDLDHPEVVGWSMGGGVAMTLAHKYPHSVSKIGLIASIVADPGVSLVVPSYKQVTGSTDEKLNYVFSNNIYQYKTRDLSKYKTAMIDSNNIFVSTDVLKRQKAALNIWLQDDKSYRMMRHISVPANILIASDDAILNPQVQWYAFENFASSDIVVMDHAGHALFYERPQQVCKAVLN